jgi:hypothetical protein
MRVILDIKTEVSYISFNVVLKFEIPITYNIEMAFRIIIRTKSKFIGFINNVTVTIKNTSVKTRFYIIKSLRIKVVFRFPFIKKVKVIFRYFKNEEDRLVFILLCDLKTRVIISVKTNIEIKKARKNYLYKV